MRHDATDVRVTEDREPVPRSEIHPMASLRMPRGFYSAFYLRDANLQFLRFDRPAPNFQDVCKLHCFTSRDLTLRDGFQDSPGRSRGAFCRGDVRRQLQLDHSFATWRNQSFQVKPEKILASG